MQFSSLLNGTASPIRSGVMWSTRKDGARTIFEGTNRAKSWIEDIGRIKASAYPPLLESIMVFSRIIFAHPFKDGNGCLARALFYTGLAGSGLVRSPCLALGPAFDLHREPLGEATVALSETGAWAAYIEFVTSMVAYSVNGTRDLLNQSTREKRNG